MSFYIKKLPIEGHKGELALYDSNETYHTIFSITTFLGNKRYMEMYPEILPVFEKAKKMIEKGETGIVVPDDNKNIHNQKRKKC
jgi:hypothetical protein